MSRDVPIRFWRGANAPRQYWDFFDPATGLAWPLAGSAFVLVVAWPQISAGGLGLVTPPGLIRHASDTAVRYGVAGDGVLAVDLALGRVTWPYTRDETLLIPQQGATYDLFRWIGDDDEMWCGGKVEVLSHLPAGALGFGVAT